MNLLSNKRQIFVYINRIIQVLVIAGVIVLLTPTKSSFKYEFQKGGFWKHESLISPFDFAIKKTDKDIEQEKKELSDNRKLYFDNNKNVVNKITEQINKEVVLQCEKNNLSTLQTDNVVYKTDDIIEKIFTHGIISGYKEDNNKFVNNSIVVIDKNIAKEYDSYDFYNKKDLDEVVNMYFRQNFKDVSDYKFVADILIKNLSPNIIYNKEKTEKILASQIADISIVKGMVAKNENIIAKGERITEEKYQILSSLRAEYEGINQSTAANILSNFGQYLLVVISLGAMTLFLYNTDKSIFLNNKKILLIYTVVLLMIFMTMFVMKLNQEYLYVVPLCLTPILIRTFFDTKTSLYVFLVLIIIIGFSVPNSFEFVFYQLIVGMMAILSVEHLEKRAEFFNTALIIFFTYSIIYLAMSFIQGSMDLKQLDINRFIYFAINAILILFAFPIVFILEKMFGLVSEMSLMEYCNTNTKILRELSNKAPGTFQHSIQVANIAEDVIHQIGGNSLLVRAGALHHDIGKIMMPMCFIENQSGSTNPLNDMTNEEGSQIIISHVSNGVKLAHKYKLPEPIVDFIRTHHGTSTTKYFYYKEINEHPETEVDKSKFSYKGPRPFSKETAVLMMVDSVEAASRSLKEHTEANINQLVDNIINGQIKDNQYDNANITFADIDKIRKILKHKLQSIYHVRIEYPINKKEKKQN